MGHTFSVIEWLKRPTESLWPYVDCQCFFAAYVIVSFHVGAQLSNYYRITAAQRRRSFRATLADCTVLGVLFLFCVGCLCAGCYRIRRRGPPMDAARVSMITKQTPLETQTHHDKIPPKHGSTISFDFECFVASSFFT